MGDPWRLLATISEPQLCFGREISLKGPLDTVEIVIEYMDMVDNVNMDMIDTVPKRVPVGTFLAFWVPIGSLFIIGCNTLALYAFALRFLVHLPLDSCTFALRFLYIYP